MHMQKYHEDVQSEIAGMVMIGGSEEVANRNGAKVRDMEVDATDTAFNLLSTRAYGLV